MQAEVSGNSSEVLKLPSVLDLRAAPAFLDDLRQRVASGGVLRCDASAVETITSPCIQIILAAAGSCERMSIRRPSPAFMSAFQDLGLEWPNDPQDDFEAEAEDVSAMAGDPAVSDDPQVSGDMSEPQSIETEEARESIPVEEAGESVEQTASEPFDQPQTSEPTTMKRILTIDDSKTIRDMLMLTLSDAGFDVLQAVDGQDGVDMLTSERVDVIITDINMPRMNGYEVIRHLRSDPEHKSTPILVLTTESTAEKKGLAREAGATGWMVKPFDPDQLIATVNRVSP